MGAFTEGRREAAKGGWEAALAWYEGYERWRRSSGLGARAKRGTLGFMLVGLVWFFVPFMIALLVEFAIIAYAVLMSALWALGAMLEPLTRLRRG